MRLAVLRRRPPRREIFEHIYRTDHWEGGSGVGSSAAATEAYRAILRRVLDERLVRSVVDIGCGDWQFSRLLDWSGVSYVGVDVVPDVIDRNTAEYAGVHVRFLCADALRTPLPGADLVIAKDVLQHWPTEDIVRFLRRVAPRYRYALLTNDVSSVHWPGEVNENIRVGAWRTLDLTKPPFNARPISIETYPVAGGAWVKHVCLLAGHE